MQPLASFVNDALPTAEAVRRCVMGAGGNVISAPVARLLHQDFTPYQLPQPVLPGDPSNISRFVKKVGIDHNSAADTHRSITFTLAEFPGLGQFNTLKEYIQLFAAFYGPLDATTGKRTKLLEVPTGVFRFTIPDRTIEDAGNEWAIEGFDLTSKLADKNLLAPYTAPAGTNVVQLVKVLLQMDEVPPSQGGRVPAGIVQPGFPQAGLPISSTPPSPTGTGTYCTTTGVNPGAVRASIDANGYWVMPNGVLYNPLGGARCDPTTYAPIDPWTCQAMPPVVASDGRALPEYYITSLGRAWYDTRSGAFVYPFDALAALQGFTAWISMVDIFKGTAFPYNQNPYQSPGNPAGFACPLATWPHDYDGSGPYYQGTATGGAGSSAPTGTGGDVSLAPWFRPTVAPTPTSVGGLSRGVHTYAFAWDFSGKPGPLGPWATVSLPNPGSANIAVPGSYGGPYGNTGLLLYRQKDGGSAFYKVTGWPGIGAASPYTDSIPDSGLGAAWVPAPSTTISSSAPPPPPPLPGNTGTGMPWPDINNPALTPSGCEIIGPNFPADRILIPPSDAVLPAPVKATTKMNLQQFCNQLLTSINYTPLTGTGTGYLVSIPMPFQSGIVPATAYSFDTRDPLSRIKPPITIKVNDQPSLANVVQVRSAKNTQLPISVTLYNRSAASMLSIDNLGYSKSIVIEDDTIVDMDILLARAAIEVDLAALGQTGVQMVTTLFPFLEDYDALGLNVYNRDRFTLEISEAPNPFICTQFSHDFDNRETTCTLGRPVPL